MKNTKGVTFEDINETIVYLKRGEYLIDGKVVSISSYNKEKVKVKNIKDIRMVTETTIFSHYIDSEENEMSVEDYDDEIRSLLKAREYNEHSEEYFFDDLDKEYVYKKFKKKWNPIKKIIQILSDPIKIEVSRTKLDSGHKHIESLFTKGESEDSMIYVYNRLAACHEIISSKFKSLNMEFKDDISYGQTNNNKVWGNSTHSGFRYVTAFNQYIFGEEWNIKYSPRGKLENMVINYNSDKKKLEEIIQIKYNEHFGFGNIGYKTLYTDLERLKNNISKIQIRVKDENKRLSLNSINKIMDNVKAQMIED